MKVTLVRIKGDWKEVLEKCRLTVHKEANGKEPSDNWKKKILLAEHSPIRSIEFDFLIEGIPSFVATHLCRHHEGCEKFVRTSRTDRTGIDRHTLPQDALVEMEIDCNIQALINISRKRLCTSASKETREVWKAIVEEVKKVDPIIASVLVPECVYRGFCPELKSCGFVDSPIYEEMRAEYIKKSIE